MKSLTLTDLNQTLVRRDKVRATALMDFANLVNSLYGRSSTHPYLIGDCTLAKMNMLRAEKRVRRTPKP